MCNCCSFCCCSCCRFSCYCCPTLRCVCVFSSRQPKTVARQVQQLGKCSNKRRLSCTQSSHSATFLMPLPPPSLLAPAVPHLVYVLLLPRTFAASSVVHSRWHAHSAHSERLRPAARSCICEQVATAFSTCKGGGAGVQGCVAEHPLKRKLPALLSLSLFAVATFWRLLRMVSCHMRWRKAAAAHMPSYQAPTPPVRSHSLPLSP